MAARRTADALVLLRRAARYEMRSQSLAPKVISLLARQLKLMWQVNELKAQGVGAGRLRELPQDVAAQLPKDGSIVPMAWRAGIIARDAGRWGRADLVRAFGLLVACDAANKGEEAGSFDTMANLEGLVVELCEGVTTAS
ncbi:MAG: hypothetical protein FJX72_10705 [Armatimonadetes bacterium]|nr:hypothetical protein [Armatimonadota bacterium]